MKLKRKQPVKESKLPLKAIDVLSIPEDNKIDYSIYDPKQYISEEAIKGMSSEALIALASGGTGPSYFSTAINVVILFPKHGREFKRDYFLKHLLNRMNDTRESQLADYAKTAVHVAMLFPEAIDELRLEKDYDNMKNTLDELHRLSIGEHMALHMLILFPDRKDELGIDNQLLYKMKDKLNNFRSQKRWTDFAITAAEFTLLFPDKKDELELDDNTFEKIKTLMQENHDDSNWYIFGLFAASLAILSADRVEISPTERFKIVREPKSLKPPTPLPERPQI